MRRRGVSALLVLAFSSAAAQDPVRPWRDWRTIATPNYRFHFARELEGWTRDVALRAESIDSAIASLVGHSTPKPIHVVVDDPFNASNGYAIPYLDRPVTVWWATPADPRNDIGNYRTWGELLAVHELTHLAHLTRPSRNPLRRGLLSTLVNLSPITTRAPRWVLEGYATLIEGRITGTGRPNNAWRPAILRQWAIEGRLPAYGQLNAFGDDFNAGAFAYLGGSAFLEWLTRREGDSSLVHVWRRLTARRVRGFDAAFTGVYGETPATLYGRHIAELTKDAMAVKAELERAGLREGELIQRLAWETGDPAVSPNGERVAVTLRERDRPGRVVVWKTAPEPEDTAETRKRIEAFKRDPQDVPDRRFYPVRKKAEKTLHALNGRPFQMPRWFADSRRVLLSRWTARSDGTLSPALYVWDTESAGVRRITRGVGVSNGDPHPNSKEAVAMQCHWGHCDIARVDLERGAMQTLLEGTPELSYYRPRYSPDGSRFVASASDKGRWRIVVANKDGQRASYVDPSDGANRYDAQWLGNDTLVVVSERGGIPNLEKLSIGDASARSLTRVTGAAVAPDVNPRDGSIWFLAMHSRGFDVRRMPRDSAIADTTVTITADRFGFAGRRVGAGIELRAREAGPTRAYGAGPRYERWFPGAYGSADGFGGFITIFSGDIVGRLNAIVTGAYGDAGTWQGGALRAAWRFARPTIELGAFGFIHEPSFGGRAQPAADSLDGSLVAGLLAFGGERRGEGWRMRARVGGSAGSLASRLGGSKSRRLGFGEAELLLQQSRGARGMVERLRGHFSDGQTLGAYQRAIGSLELGTIGRDVMPVRLGVIAGKLVGEPHPFERFSIGGSASPVTDSALLSQRYAMPWFPTATATGRALLAWRIALPSTPWTTFYEGASVGDDLYRLRKWNRAVGVEIRSALGPIPVAYLPRLEVRGGAAYTLDAPFRKKIRGFLEMKFEP